MKKDIVIIDSGVYREHPLLKEVPIECWYVCQENDEYVLLPGGEDQAGHGTAVCGTIFSDMDNRTDCQTLMIKIYDRELTVELDALLFVLSYIENSIDCDILHISSGVLEYSSQLEEQCKRLYQKGICIVAAFDNDGAVSYPAAFKEVIGVDASMECRKRDEWIYVENGVVDVLAKGGNHRLAWISPTYILTQGASFSAGYITSVIYQQLKKGLPKEDIRTFLWQGAIRLYNRADNETSSSAPVFDFPIREAVLFPYNKEMHSLVNYCELLPFPIRGIYSSKYLGQIGQTAVSLNGQHCYPIENIDHIDWNTVDTIILGHVQEVSRAAGIDYKTSIAEKCLEHHINLYAFDSDGLEPYRELFEEKNIGLYYPKLSAAIQPKKDGKLYAIGTPVLGVLGTSSAQGKFTLQLMLRKLFLGKGYTLGQMGTEPSALLFGMDTMYPFGYASSVAVREEEAVELLNGMMHEMEIKQPDILLVGSQSGTIPAYFHSTKYLNIPQLMYLLGTKPDAVILCVNLFDDSEYIRRTVSVIENLAECAVIAIAVSPMIFSGDLALIRQRKEMADPADIRAFADMLQSDLSRPVFVMMEEAESLFETCLSFFSEGGDE
ncbi:MAG: DUF1611 domain-containing protein [Clostridiales bacterium]|jgi:hypothetical protein|nr:DUF1611 domain-containing protein [Clostridiales bacterium]